MKKHSRYKLARRALLFWCLFIGIGAVAGATGMLAEPNGSALGFDALLPYFQVLPFADVLFQNFIFAGISLLVVNGISNLAAAALILAKKKAGIALGGVFGITLMLWICIQFVILPPNFMSTIYFFFGLAQALTGFAASVFYKQESFTVRREDYANIGTNKSELVVYFSRMGYTRKAALEQADKTGAEIYEIRSTEQVEGTGGFWWCGRYGMHRWEMPIEKISIELSDYEKVTICSPIWVFSVAAPVRAFCREASGKIKNVSYILLHHMNSSFSSAADEMDSILGVKHTGFRSVCCQKGKIKHIEGEI